jgi:hypothetical protein
MRVSINTPTHVCVYVCIFISLCVCVCVCMYVSFRICMHEKHINVGYKQIHADSSDREVYGVGLRPLACWDLGSNPAGGMDVCFL